MQVSVRRLRGTGLGSSAPSAPTVGMVIFLQNNLLQTDRQTDTRRSGVRRLGLVLTGRRASDDPGMGPAVRRSEGGDVGLTGGMHVWRVDDGNNRRGSWDRRVLWWRRPGDLETCGHAGLGKR